MMFMMRMDVQGCRSRYPKTEFKIDLAIVRENRYGWERLIHRKTGFVAFDQWYWNEAPSSRGLTDKVRDIKRENLWLEVIDL